MKQQNLFILAAVGLGLAFLYRRGAFNGITYASGSGGQAVNNPAVASYRLSPAQAQAAAQGRAIVPVSPETALKYTFAQGLINRIFSSGAGSAASAATAMGPQQPGVYSVPVSPSEFGYTDAAQQIDAGVYTEPLLQTSTPEISTVGGEMLDYVPIDPSEFGYTGEF
jgi:hypothetical protein